MNMHIGVYLYAVTETECSIVLLYKLKNFTLPGKLNSISITQRLFSTRLTINSFYISQLLTHPVIITIINKC